MRKGLIAFRRDFEFGEETVDLSFKRSERLCATDQGAFNFILRSFAKHKPRSAVDGSFARVGDIFINTLFMPI